ncbi:MAG: T9SS type A sorting domain-containing protein [Prolixibacteraceae bacterium]|nr:T9SS type A sorting domain-containing protein [Prolixibacteraceae bacterium]
MKISTFVILLFIPFSVFSQVEITLNVNQPPELGFDITSQDTTIVAGESVQLGNDIVVFGGSEDYHYTWLPGESLNDASLRNPLASPADTTTYQLTVTDNNGCSFSVDYKVNVREKTNSSDFTAGDVSPLNVMLYPNPNTGHFRVRLKGLPADKIELNIIDINGRCLYKSTVSGFTGEHTGIIQTDIRQGTYILEVKSDKTDLRTTFIIDKSANL